MKHYIWKLLVAFISQSHKKDAFYTRSSFPFIVMNPLKFHWNLKVKNQELQELLEYFWLNMTDYVEDFRSSRQQLLQGHQVHVVLLSSTLECHQGDVCYSTIRLRGKSNRRLSCG